MPQVFFPSHWVMLLKQCITPLYCPQFAGDINHVSATYRLFKLPNNQVSTEAKVTYTGTMEEFQDQLNFDSTHCFKVSLIKGQWLHINHWTLLFR